ncbi:MAG: L-threonylcarbamoyladenylate synthase [Thermodesulfobacteriota bacterium]|nr:L-threonylcarbamoyladenylate synthase [Thermodesulfobacteriota bacterium]
MKASDKVRKISSVNPETDVIAEAAYIIRNGGVVVFPTRSLYGLGADAFNAKAVNRIFHIKLRPINKPVLVLIKDKDELNRLAAFVPPAATAIMERFWPGRISIVFQAKEVLSANLTAGTKKIGIRLPEHNIAYKVVKAAGGPITGTSANLSGNAGCFQINDLDEKIVDSVDLILDAGPLRGGVGSTVVDVTGDTPMVLRQGELSQKDILNVIDNLSLF